MKSLNIFSLATVLFSTAGLASDRPNLVNCTDEAKKIELNYAASSFSGDPQFVLRIDGEQVFPPRSQSVLPSLVSLKTETTVFGDLVSALDATRTPIDAPTDIYSLFIPSFITDLGQEVRFETMLLSGTAGGFIPEWVPAQRIASATKLTCSGNVVVF